jgi:hypothetical protein
VCVFGVTTEPWGVVDAVAMTADADVAYEGMDMGLSLGDMAAATDGVASKAANLDDTNALNFDGDEVAMNAVVEADAAGPMAKADGVMVVRGVAMSTPAVETVDAAGAAWVVRGGVRMPTDVTGFWAKVA